MHSAGSREPERDVNGVEHDMQLCRPMQGSATMSCVDDKNLNTTKVHQELVTVDISESLLQLQELQQSSSLHDPLLGVSSHELATCEGAEMNFFEQGNNNPREVCPSIVECSIPQVMGLIGIMLVGSLTALDSSVVVPVKNSVEVPLPDGFLLMSLDMWRVLCSLSFAYLPFLECQPLCCMRIFRSWALVSGLNYRNRIRLL